MARSEADIEALCPGRPLETCLLVSDKAARAPETEEAIPEVGVGGRQGREGPSKGKFRFLLKKVLTFGWGRDIINAVLNQSNHPNARVVEW